jgi:3-oxoacyl-[acyl-carrier-protein] synthase II
MRRVVVTGMGAVSPVGNNVATSWYNAVNGISGIGLITLFNISDFSTKIAGEVKDFDPALSFSAKMVARTDRFIHFGMAAVKEAIEDSKILDYTDLDKDNVGMILGSGIGGVETIAENTKILEQGGPRKISPFFMTSTLSNMLAGYVSIDYGFKGMGYSIASACATGNHCFGDAYLMIKNGLCDAVVAGSAESPICPLGLAGFIALRALSKNNDNPIAASRPFDAHRDGFVMAEGAAVLILEDYDHAKKRGAKIYAEIVGYGATCDAYHITAPCTDGAVRSMQMAIKAADISKKQIGYINAHGTSTNIGDMNETEAIKKVFANDAYNVNISSTKSVTGHLLGAASAIEAVFTIKALQTGIIPPTINLNSNDPDCDLNYTANQAVEKYCEFAISNSFGFGGTNSTIVFKRFN